jgi:rod shape determining protein RodA
MISKKVIEALKKYDFSFIGISAAIFIIGIINLYSATHSSDKIRLQTIYQVQLGIFLFSIFVAFVISLLNSKNFLRYAYPIFAFNVFLLLLVLVLGKIGMGAQRWLVLGPIRIQPSELMKVSLVLALARWFRYNCVEGQIGLKELIVPILITAIPTVLIILQPDLGTGLILLLIFFVIAFYRKLKWKTIGIITLAALMSGAAMYNFGLKEYQKKRIITFINPQADARGSGYNAIQSKIAIGSGQFFGKGFKKSSQVSLNYLPENHTDFVFSIFNEEHGFFGSLVLISLYGLLFFRFLSMAKSVNSMFESILMIGLASIFFWHTFVNMGMVMGLMPIVGLPLPYMSYGGSSLLTFGICIGIATSVSNSKNIF